MKCFYHPQADAVGTCKHCHRGVCSACAAERDGGLACRGRCEAEVDAVNALIRRNQQVMSGASWPILLRVVIYWGMCAALLYFAFMQMESSMRLVSFGLAAITFLAGLASARWLVKPSIKTHQ